jgi:hypothetical protein
VKAEVQDVNYLEPFLIRQRTENREHRIDEIYQIKENGKG